MPQNSITRDARKLLAFGSGVGIEIGAKDLEVVVARVRLSRVQVLGHLAIENFAETPAAEWGSRYARLLKSLGLSYLTATVLLPRREVIVRQIALPGVASKDIEGAVRFQLDSLHPYGEDEVVWGWSPLSYGSVLVGIVRREAVERYHQLFLEAGIAVSSFTFSAAAVHAAVRLNGFAYDSGFVALSRTATGAVEVYGESPSRPVYSAEFALPMQRAAVVALSELRLPPETAPLKLEQVLPKPELNPVENDLSRNALPYATALAGACPRFAPAANVLPQEHRRSSSRAMFIPTIALGVLVVAVAAGIAIYSKYSERQYLRKLNAEIAQLEPKAQRSAAMERQITQMRSRAQLLDRFRNQTSDDLDTLSELTSLVQPPAWTNAVDLARDSVRVSGEAPQAAPLPRILDGSPFFEGSTLDSVGKSQAGGLGEVFQIHAAREKRK